MALAEGSVGCVEGQCRRCGRRVERGWSVGGRTRRSSLLNQPALGQTCQCSGNMNTPSGFTGQRSPPARSDAPLHPARRIARRKATWRQVEDP